MERIYGVFLLLFSIVFLLTGCQFMPQRQINKAVDKTTGKYLTELKRQEEWDYTRSSEIYDWETALSVMYEKNPTCVKAMYQVEDAKVNQRRIWRRFIPGLTLGVSDTVSLDELSEVFVDPSYRINSFLALGNLISLPKDVYERKVMTIAAELAEQQTMREQVIKLYKFFETKRLWTLEGEGLDLLEQFTSVLVSVDPAEALKEEVRLEEQREKWLEREESWKKQLGDFYNVLGGEVDLDARSIPSIKYSSRDLDFYDTQRWGKLQLKLLALQELGQDGRIKEAYLRYLPRPYLGVSAPPIYSNTSDSGFKVEDIRISPRISWSLDTQGTIGNQVRRLKREKPFQDWERDRRVRNEVQKLLEGRELLRETEEELVSVQQTKKEYIEFIKEGLVAQSPELILTKLQSLYKKEIMLEAKVIEISTAYWMIDETWWSKYKTPWKKK